MNIANNFVIVKYLLVYLHIHVNIINILKVSSYLLDIIASCDSI